VADLGQVVVLGAFLIALLGVGAALYGARAGVAELVVSARHGVYALAGLLTLASATLVTAFLQHDFRLQYVVEHSNRAMPTALVGAGTVRRPTELVAVANAGAQFAVSPGLTTVLARAAVRHSIPLLPGVMTPAVPESKFVSVGSVFES